MRPTGEQGWERASILFFAAGIPLQSARAQNLPDLISACGGTSDLQLAWCQETALAVQAAQGALGLAASGGTDLPGSASTLGWRMKGSPRFALSLRGSFTRAPAPSLEGSGGLPEGETTLSLPSIHFSGTMGLFDGFSLGPTVGGFGSVDLTISTQWIAPPKAKGFQENVMGWGIGTRIGVLRESFSLPGISLSAFHRSLGTNSLWEVDEGDPAEAVFDVRVSSLRGVIGKDIGGIGVFGGAGWDRYTGDALLVVTDPGGGGLASTGAGELRSERRLYFFGGSMNFLALQVSAEVGWTEGFDPDLPTSFPGGFDPSSGSEFGSLAFRLTF
ncbi:MAG: hypothetical protein ABIF09_09250 [Gemmatimonadota bacterium]